MNCNKYNQKFEKEISFIEESKTIGYQKKLNMLDENEKFQFTNHGICPNCREMKVLRLKCFNCKISFSECNKCERPYIISGEEWCQNCDTKRFLEESEVIGHDKKLDQLSKDEKIQFKQYGICPVCKLLKINSRTCPICKYGKYGRCNKCKQPYTSEEKWCNVCDSKRFLEESETIGYHKKFNELSRAEKFQFKQYGICFDCKRMKIHELCFNCK